MKSVLMSIQPYYVFLIIARIMRWDIPQEKTIEVRKDYPKDSEWNKVTHIYCSKNRKSFNRIPKQYQPFMAKLLGKVIGEFVCDAIISHCEMANADIAEQQGRIKREALAKYSNGKQLYGWHISDLKIYDKPKELGDFFVKGECENYDYCRYCKNFHEGRGWLDGSYCDEDSCITWGIKPITRPPQSWCYMEV